MPSPPADDPAETVVAIPGDGSVKVGQMSAGDVTALITIFQNMLDRTERRILERLDANAAGATERWSLHEKEHGGIDAKMSAVEATMTQHLSESSKVWAHYREEELAEEARIAPVRTAAQWLWQNWRTILLLIVALVAILGFSGETLDRVTHTLFQ